MADLILKGVGVVAYMYMLIQKNLSVAEPVLIKIPT